MSENRLVKAYNDGLADGIKKHSFCEDGITFVGDEGKTLTQALEESGTLERGFLLVDCNVYGDLITKLQESLHFISTGADRQSYGAKRIIDQIQKLLNEVKE